MIARCVPPCNLLSHAHELARQPLPCPIIPSFQSLFAHCTTFVFGATRALSAMSGPAGASSMSMCCTVRGESRAGPPSSGLAVKCMAVDIDPMWSTLEDHCSTLRFQRQDTEATQPTCSDDDKWYQVNVATSYTWSILGKQNVKFFPPPILEPAFKQEPMLLGQIRSYPLNRTKLKVWFSVLQISVKPNRTDYHVPVGSSLEHLEALAIEVRVIMPDVNCVK